MKNRIARIVAAMAMVFGVGVTTVGVANATQTPDLTLGPCNPGWYVNLDEVDRKPKPTKDGLEFTDNELVHHSANLALADLTPGTYVAMPAPDQPSFFSVEVKNDNGAYGTLRWNANAAMWQITIGAGNGATVGTFSGADPVALLGGKVTKWGAFDGKPIKVISFGVGYTANPPGTVKTVVASVTFKGTTYDMKCKPSSSSSSASASASATASSSSSKSPSASSSSSASQSASATATTSSSSNPVVVPTTRPPVTGGGLALTGASVPLIAGGGLLAIVAGAALFYFGWYRKPKAEFGA